jgi:hypothetical protein
MSSKVIDLESRSPLKQRVFKRRFESSATGFDDGLVGMTSDPFSQTFPQGPGLRIPAIFPLFASDVGPLGRPRFLFLLSSRVVRAKTRLAGIRQGLTIGMDLNHVAIVGSGVMRPIELLVTTPNFRFVDGNVSWHLVMEKADKIINGSPSTDTNNWRFVKSDTPAMLYQTFANTTVQPLTGAPLIYSQGLTAYTPPQIFQNWLPIPGGDSLFNFHDIRFKWDSDHANDDLKYDFDAHCRVSLYASVLQSNPEARTPQPAILASPAIAGLPPEEAFIASLTGTAGEATDGPIFWRVFGDLIWEDDA